MNHGCDYRLNWTTPCPVTNKLKTITISHKSKSFIFKYHNKIWRIAWKMTVKIFSKHSTETKPPQFYKINLELVTIVIINVVIGGYSGVA